jgi:flagellar protein FlbD
MITLTKLDGTYFALNPDLIETVIENPDTTIHLTNKKFYIVKETLDEVVAKVIEFRKEINVVFDRRSGRRRETCSGIIKIRQEPIDGTP